MCITPTPSVKLTWTKLHPAPLRFLSSHGTAIVNGNTAYFSYAHNIYSFDLPNKKWTNLPQNYYRDFGMAIIDSELTTVGGCSASHKTQDLLTFQSGGWKNLLPFMPTARAQPAVVTVLNFLVVAGGVKDSSPDADVVEVLNIATRQWSTAKCLPQALSSPQMVWCNKQLYISNNASFFSCSVEDLLRSCNPVSTVTVWNQLADIPVSGDSSLLTLCDSVLILGGNEAILSRYPTAAIHGYNQVENKWIVVDRIPSPRYGFLSAILTSNGVKNVVMVGGWNDGLPTDEIFIGSLLEGKTSDCVVM